MINIWLAFGLALVFGGVGMLCMAMCAAGGQADECAECEWARWHKEEGA